jgi:hypothetical protein
MFEAWGRKARLLRLPNHTNYIKSNEINAVILYNRQKLLSDMMRGLGLDG